MSHGESFQEEKGRVPSPEEKSVFYQNATTALAGLLEGEREPGILMSSVVAVLHHTMPHYFWTGFYRVVGDSLCVGPYQGTPACLRIARGRGVCGTAWADEKPIVVEDVNAFPGHIACDARSASEIVIPWHNHRGEVVAILDVDSTLPAAFDATDRDALLELAAIYRLD